MNGSNLTPGQIRAETNRLGRRFRSFAKHRKALDQAIAAVDEDLDPKAWREAFESPEPEMTNKVISVTGGYSNLVNNYAEIARTSARLAGLMSGRRPNIEQSLEALAGKGALTADEAAMVKELYGIEGRMEHLSPDLSAEEIREAIVRLRRELPRLMEKALTWLEGQGFKIA